MITLITVVIFLFTHSWWAMFSHLGWSLLDRSEESGPMISVDPSSVLLARIFYAAFLIMGVVLLINMLIALLSSTYQKTEVKTWLIIVFTSVHKVWISLFLVVCKSNLKRSFRDHLVLPLVTLTYNHIKLDQ